MTKRGRPPMRAKDRQSMTIILKINPKLKAALRAAANKNSLPLAVEIKRRLVASLTPGERRSLEDK